MIKRLEWQGLGVPVMIENVTDRCDKEIGVAGMGVPVMIKNVTDRCDKEIGVAGIGGCCNDRECY